MANEVSDKDLGFSGFGHGFKLDAFFSVEAAKDFFRDSHSGSGFTLKFFFGKFGLIEGDFLDFVFAFLIMGLSLLFILNKGKFY
jgi:hypothetical protein